MEHSMFVVFQTRNPGEYLQALGEGCYSWRHDQVLKTIDEAITCVGEVVPPSQLPRKPSPLSEPLPKKPSAGILTSAKIWKLLVGLERQLNFFGHIGVNTL